MASPCGAPTATSGGLRRRHGDHPPLLPAHLQAAAGSKHGCDVVEHGRFNVELGGEPAYRRLVESLHAHGLGQVLDIVPNHMAAKPRENPSWWGVLENGPSRRFAAWFDIDWEAPDKAGATVLVPVLGDHYGRAIDAGELRVVREGGSFGRGQTAVGPVVDLLRRFGRRARDVLPSDCEPRLRRSAPGR